MKDEKFRRNLKALFDPAAVSVIGASDNPDKLGFHVMKSLIQGGFEGRIVPVNPGSKTIMGIAASSSLESFNGSIDVAVVVVPAQIVPLVFEECEKKVSKALYSLQPVSRKSMPQKAANFRTSWQKPQQMRV